MTAALEPGIATPRPFAKVHGPFLRLLHRLHLTRADGSPRAWALCAIAWVPLCIAALLRIVFGQRPAPILSDLSVHARLLITLPLVILAERLLERRCAGAVNQLYRGTFAEQASLDRIVERAERLRESRLAELAILVVAILGGQAALWGLFGATGVFAGVADAGSVSFARLWYVTVAFPIVQFLLWRWLWHWLTWSYLVVRVSRLQLATIATHPDHAGGLGFVAGPLSAFSAFVLAVATMISSAWATQMLSGSATLQTFVPSFFVFVLIAFFVACAPLLAFMGTLYRARVRDIARYNGLALDYVREFDAKWIESRTEPLVSTPDISSLADLCNAYDSLVKIRPVPFGPRPLLGIWIAALIPMIPLVATSMPINELLLRIGGALLGGLPV